LNFFNGFRGREFVDSGHSQNRFALVNRLHSETALAPLASLDHRAIVGKGILNGREHGQDQKCEAWAFPSISVAVTLNISDSQKAYWISN
jgi:hypothetical protein